MDRIATVVFLVALLLAACTPVPQYSGSPGAAEAVARATMAAVQLEVAAGTAESVVATATAASDSMTRAADEMATATVASAKATDRALEIRATEQAMSYQDTRTALQAESEATIGAASAFGTATAIGRLAAVEEQLAARESDRLSIANERARSAIRIKEVAAITAGAVIIAAVVAGLVYLLIIAYSNNMARIIEAPAGANVVAKDREGWVILSPAAPTGPDRQLSAGSSPNNGAVIGEVPAVVELPEQLPPGKIGLGLTPGRQLWYSQKALGDILGAGMKGSGKSSLVRSLAYQARMQGWKVYLADAEALTFEPDVWGQVASDANDVEALLATLLIEFDGRLELYRRAFDKVRQELPANEQFFVEDLEAYNKAAGRFGLDSLRPMMLAWDEANNHLGSSRSLDQALHELLRRNRKPGLTIVLAGHTWHASQVSSAIFTNLTRRICLRCEERTSRVVLGDPAAASLPSDQPGLAMMRENGRLGRLKTFYLPARRILRDVRPDPNGVWQVVDDVQAEEDADKLAGRPQRSRRQVALALAGVDNGWGYERADAALSVLAERGETWAAELMGDA